VKNSACFVSAREGCAASARLLAILSAIVATLAVGTAWADDDRASRERDAIVAAGEGRDAFERGDLNAAIMHYKLAFDLTQDPAFAYNLGMLHQHVGNLPDARGYLIAFIELAPDVDARESVENEIARIDAELELEWARVGLSSDPPGAQVFQIDGEATLLIGTAPLEYHFRPATLTFEWRHRGYHTTRRTVDAAQGSNVSVIARLSPIQHRHRRAHRFNPEP